MCIEYLPHLNFEKGLPWLTSMKISSFSNLVCVDFLFITRLNKCSRYSLFIYELFVYNETILGETHLEWNSFKLLNFLYNETILGEKSQKSALKEDYIRYIPPWQGTFAYHCSFIKLYAKVIRCCTLVKCLYQYYVIIT